MNICVYSAGKEIINYFHKDDIDIPCEANAMLSKPFFKLLILLAIINHLAVCQHKFCKRY